MKQKKLAIIYYIPSSSFKYDTWVDGFTASIDILKNIFDVQMINLYDSPPQISYLNSFDFLLFKSNWDWFVDIFYKSNINSITTKSGIMISGSTPPTEPHLYDVLFYETPWYEQFVTKHQMAVHAFGINTDVMQPFDLEKNYDWIAVGAFKPYKRYELLFNKPGKGVIIGEYPPKKAMLMTVVKQYITNTPGILTQLKRAGIETIDFISYKDLCNRYNASKHVYVPAELHGGGERCVLEARACEISVSIESDNPKLESLLDSPIYDHRYYANQLQLGINSVL